MLEKSETLHCSQMLCIASDACISAYVRRDRQFEYDNTKEVCVLFELTFMLKM